jgi:hypothetical protein
VTARRASEEDEKKRDHDEHYDEASRYELSFAAAPVRVGSGSLPATRPSTGH